jgi:phage terminase large subunit
MNHLGFLSSESSGLQIALRDTQLQVLNSLNRFNVLLAHRRFGKTVLAIVVLILKALECRHHRPQVFYYAPTYQQAKRVAWAYLRDICGSIPGTVFNEAELKATLPNGGVIQLGSADSPDASRGIYADFVVLDEPAQMHGKMWYEVLRPALSDRKGGCLMIGTPAGRHGLFYESHEQAADDPDWWRGVYRASETGIVDREELSSAARGMSPAEYEQEFECSWDASVRGAYWATAMEKCDKEERITKVIHRSGALVHVSLDLGVSDATAAWFFQTDGDQIRVLAYAEYTNMGLPHIIADFKARPYQIGKVICPHDIKVRSLSTGETRLQTLQNLGVDVIVAPNIPIIDGIELARRTIDRCVFDRDACREGLECLRQYRSDWDDKKGVMMLRPRHDFASHGADSFRYLSVNGTDTLIGSWGEIDYSRMDKWAA